MIQEHQGLINGLCAVYSRRGEHRDLRQEVLLQLWKAYGNFRHESKESTWIYRVSLNTILAIRRKANRQIDWQPMHEEPFNEMEIAPYSDDHLQLLYQAIDQLADLDKAITILYLEGYPHKEIASLLELTATNVSTRFNRIKMRLKKILNSKMYGLK